MLDLLLHSCQRTIYPRSLGTLLLRSAQQALIELLLILTANPVLQLILALWRILFHRSVHNFAIVERFIGLILGCVDSASFRLCIDAGDNRIGDISASILFVINFFPRFFL